MSFYAGRGMQRDMAYINVTGVGPWDLELCLGLGLVRVWDGAD